MGTRQCLEESCPSKATVGMAEGGLPTPWVLGSPTYPGPCIDSTIGLVLIRRHVRHHPQSQVTLRQSLLLCILAWWPPYAFLGQMCHLFSNTMSTQSTSLLGVLLCPLLISERPSFLQLGRVFLQKFCQEGLLRKAEAEVGLDQGLK